MEGSGQTTGRSHHSRLLGEVNDRVFDVLRGLGSEDGEFLLSATTKAAWRHSS